MFLMLGGGSAAAQAVDYSTDTGLSVGGGFVDDGYVVNDNRDGTVDADDVLRLPRAVDLVGLERAADGAWLFVLDTSAYLGGVLFTQSDVGRFANEAYSLAFDGSAQGVPAGVGIDAVTRDGDDLILSFDTTLAISAVVIEDEDLVRFGRQGITLEFDGSAAGILQNLDLDAAHRTPEGILLLSFSSHGAVFGIAFADEDVLALDPSAGVWSKFLDGSALHGELAPTDLDALHVAATPGELLFHDGFESLGAQFRAMAPCRFPGYWQAAEYGPYSCSRTARFGG